MTPLQKYKKAYVTALFLMIKVKYQRTHPQSKIFIMNHTTDNICETNPADERPTHQKVHGKGCGTRCWGPYPFEHNPFDHSEGCTLSTYTKGLYE